MTIYQVEVVSQIPREKLERVQLCIDSVSKMLDVVQRLPPAKASVHLNTIKRMHSNRIKDMNILQAP